MSKIWTGIKRFLESILDDPIKLIGYFLFLVACFLGMGGYINQNWMYETSNGELVRRFQDSPFLRDFYANIAAELASIAITVLILDYFYDDRQNKRLKAQLIRQLGSRHNEVADTAANELRHHGWLTDGSLVGANLAKANLSGAKLSGTNLSGAKLYEAILRGIKLTEANLSESHLAGTDLSKADLTKANLTGVKLWRANLGDANLTKANLTGADLSNADLTGADLTGADLRGASLRGADLSGSQVTISQLAQATLNKNTTMPNDEKWMPSDK